ncbi:ATP-binding protein [Streptomyces sp. B8F3]|uniref:ATP-binding protein n=1 Tax=Streptomyces sp. B8F3 TaxID=3153573 RepID=UPI00325DE976
MDLAATTRLVTAELAAAAAERRVGLTAEAEDATPVRGDRILLRHLMTNVVRNAVQYNHPGGRVRVRIEGRTVTVVNTGPPVPADKIPALFEPFRRLTPDRTAPTPGNGLGLPVAASIAEAHAAALTATPGPQGGLTVTLRFPPAP